MRRPLSQHLFALAADLERTRLTLHGLSQEALTDGDLGQYGRTWTLLEEAMNSLDDATRGLLEAGERVKAP